jgi:hypothetical protein
MMPLAICASIRAPALAELVSPVTASFASIFAGIDTRLGLVVRKDEDVIVNPDPLDPATSTGSTAAL